MKFTLIKEGGTHQKGYKVKAETLHVEDWYKEYLIKTCGEIRAENTLNSEIDGLWDMYGDIVADENGTFYIAEKDFKSEEHFGEYSFWAEVERV